MKEWAYRATEKRRSLEDTRGLIEGHGILARSVHKRDQTTVPFVREVEAGDVVHVYYGRSKKQGTVKLGSYRVLGAEEPRFPLALEATALIRIAKVVENDALLDFLRAVPDGATGYKEDPGLDAFTGFRIERIPDMPQPDVEVWQFPRQGTLTDKRAEALPPEALIARITHDTAVMAGRACIRGMRVTVGTVLGLLAAGHSEGEILAEYPYLELLDVRAALAYAAYRLGEREIPLEAA